MESTSSLDIEVIVDADGDATHVMDPADVVPTSRDADLPRHPSWDTVDAPAGRPERAPQSATAGSVLGPPLPTEVRDPGRYHFLGEHGRGGLGRVSRVHDRQLGRDVAIKELLTLSKENELRFLREVLITARLEHPGIVPIHEAGRWADGTPFYAMKLVAGRPLRELIVERKTTVERLGLLHHVIAVADAIAYAHGRNIIHRDLKPGNVIVGDFGETIVIDWGIAKDLTTTETSSVDSSPFRIPSEGDLLTSAGGILGTPAYMAPEQMLGQPVDQRADVYAIGVMLWELCAARRSLPDKLSTRRRILRRAGIDKDLATIIEKALDPDPDRRYRDAGALAADLKAFKSGARIAARHYSLFAMLAHWTRRHRTLALSAAAAITIAITGSLLYVRNIAAERDRADTSEAAAKRARAATETSLDELILKHAQLLLITDPSAAIDALAHYGGSDVGRAEQIRAEARGRGVAFIRALPHTENIRWVEVAPDGAIISLGLDGTITRTALDGTSVVLARNVSRSGVSTYSSSRRLLAYTCDPSDICLFDVRRGVRFPVAAVLKNANAAGIAISPDGALLAMMSADARLKLLDVTDPAQPTIKLDRPIEGGVDVEFISDDVAVAGTMTGIEFIRASGRSERYALPDISRWSMGTREQALALATTKGQAVVLESFPLRVVARAELCPGSTADMHFLSGRRSIAYACSDGAIGIWDLQRGTVRPRAQLEGHADLITASPSGDYIAAAGGTGTLTVLDLATDVIASYKGHGFRLSTILPPTPEHPFLVSGDAHGGIRAWPLPPRLTRVAATSSSPFSMAIFDRQSAVAIATTSAAELTIASPSTGQTGATYVRTVGPHLSDNLFLDRSAAGAMFAAYGLSDVVELWSTTPVNRIRDINTGHGSLSQLQFVGDGDDFITSGRDGRLVRWPSAGEPVVLAHVDQPVDKFAAVGATGSIVFSTMDGALWRTGADGRAQQLRAGGSRVNRIRAVPDQPIAYAGTASGDVISINTRSWQHELLLTGAGAVRDIAVGRDGRTIAVTSNDGTIRVGTYRDAASFPREPTWATLALSARNVALAPDGLVVASCTDGTIWLYSPAPQRWLCLPTGTVDLGRTAVADDGKTAVTVDYKGRLIAIDLEAARKQLEMQADVPHELTHERTHDAIR